MPVALDVGTNRQDLIDDSLKTLEDELRFVLITSAASTREEGDKPAHAVPTEIDGVWIEAEPSEHAKCVRCWHHREDVGHDADHPELCGRCAEVVLRQAQDDRNSAMDQPA